MPRRSTSHNVALLPEFSNSLAEHYLRVHMSGRRSVPEFLRDRLASCTSGLGILRCIVDRQTATCRLCLAGCRCQSLRTIHPDVIRVCVHLYGSDVPEFLRDRLAFCISGLGISRVVTEVWILHMWTTLDSGQLRLYLPMVLARPVLLVSPRSGHLFCCRDRGPAIVAHLGVGRF